MSIGGGCITIFLATVLHFEACANLFLNSSSLALHCLFIFGWPNGDKLFFNWVISEPSKVADMAKPLRGNGRGEIIKLCEKTSKVSPPPLSIKLDEFPMNNLSIRLHLPRLRPNLDEGFVITRPRNSMIAFTNHFSGKKKLSRSRNWFQDVEHF